MMQHTEETKRFVNILMEASKTDAALESYRNYMDPKIYKAIMRTMPDFEWKMQYLQWAALREWATKKPVPPADNKIRKLLGKYARRWGMGAEEVAKTVSGNEFEIATTDLDHIASFITPGAVAYIQKAHDLVGKTVSPGHTLEKINEYAKESSPNVIREEDVNPEAKILIDFGDGFAWWNLGVASCKEEAKAGGHCGNSPRSNTDDVILSLRERITDSLGQVYYKVHLTFVLSYGGYLTEMKAQYNRKPGPEYHKYIVPLLEHPIVKGIAEGFYETENDFNITDLSDDEIIRLVTMKPALGNHAVFNDKKLGLDRKLYYQYMRGMEELGERIAKDAVESSDFLSIDPTTSTVILDVGAMSDNLYQPQPVTAFLSNSLIFNDVTESIFIETEDIAREKLEYRLEKMPTSEFIEEFLKPAYEYYNIYADREWEDLVEEVENGDFDYSGFIYDMLMEMDELIDVGEIIDAAFVRAEAEILPIELGTLETFYNTFLKDGDGANDVSSLDSIIDQWLEVEYSNEMFRLLDQAASDFVQGISLA